MSTLMWERGWGGGDLVKRHIGACVFASSLSMKIFYDIKDLLKWLFFKEENLCGLSHF